MLRLADGTLLLGVDYDGGGGPYFVWRSTDGGQTWDKTQKCEPKDFQSQYGFFGGETWLWQATVRQDLGAGARRQQRIADQGPPDHRRGTTRPITSSCSSSSDGAKTFDRIRDFGDYGEMYMSLLRLQDQRLLLTFTVRDLQPPLGVRAILGTETDDGFEFDFAHDRIMLDTKTGSAATRAAASAPPCNSTTARWSRRAPIAVKTTSRTWKSSAGNRLGPGGRRDSQVVEWQGKTRRRHESSLA